MNVRNSCAKSSLNYVEVEYSLVQSIGVRVWLYLMLAQLGRCTPMNISNPMEHHDREMDLISSKSVTMARVLQGWKLNKVVVSSVCLLYNASHWRPYVLSTYLSGRWFAQP